MHGPDPANPHPMNGFPQVCFIKNTIKGPNIEVGDYTYYDDPEDSAGFERNQTSGFSTYPFFIFGNGWEHAAPAPGSLPYKGDTVIGNDVWIGYDALIMPGVKVGNGAIIAARSVVTGDVPAYAVVGGNPAKVIRYRFDDDTIARLNAIAWWDWPVEQISHNLPLISGGEIVALEAATP